MASEEFEILSARLVKRDEAYRRIADIVRRALIQIIQVLEREFDLPPLRKPLN